MNGPRVGSLAALQALGLALTLGSAAATPIGQVPAWRDVSLHFEQVGTGDRPQYLARSAGLALSLDRGDASLWLCPSPRSPLLSARRALTVGFRLLDPVARPDGQPEEPLPTRIHHFQGANPDQWRRDEPAHARVRFPGVYPGIDVVYYGNGGQLEYDFEVAPGADPGRIRFAVQGADEVRLNASGDLELRVGTAHLRQLRPVAYQMVDGARQVVTARFVQDSHDPRQVGFALGEYDSARPLVIDPVVWYAALFGGSEFDLFRRMLVLPEGGMVVVGETASPNLPVTNAIPSTDIVWVTNFFYDPYGKVIGQEVLTNFVGTTNHGGAGLESGNPLGTDALVARFSADGRTLESATYLGGAGIDAAMDVALAPDGSLLVYGLTQSGDFPVVSNQWLRLATTHAPFTNQFVVTNRWTFTNTTLVTNSWWVTNALGEWVITNHVTVETTYAYTNVVYTNAVAGSVVVPTNTWPIPEGWTPVFKLTNAGPVSWGYYASDGFLARLSPTADALLFSAFQGGTGDDYGARVAVADDGRVYTLLYRGPSAPLLTCLTSDALVYQVGWLPPGNTLGLWPTLDGELWVAGDTTSSALSRSLAWWPPGDPNAPFQPFQDAIAGGRDAYAVRVDPRGVVDYYTYFGGTLDDYAAGIVVNSDGGVTLAGQTFSTNLPTAAALYPTHSGGSDLYVSRLDGALSNLVFSTYWGGPSNEVAQVLRAGPAGDFLIGGATPAGGLLLGLSSDGQRVNGSAGASLLGHSTVVYDLHADAEGSLWVAGATGSGTNWSAYFGDHLVQTNWWIPGTNASGGAVFGRSAGFLAQMYLGPDLEIGRVAGRPVVTWPVLLTNYFLESLDEIEQTNRWTNVVGSVAAGTNWLYLPTNPAQQFFRLRQQPPTSNTAAATPR